jgi:hypothetical protein
LGVAVPVVAGFGHPGDDGVHDRDEPDQHERTEAQELCPHGRDVEMGESGIRVGSGCARQPPPGRHRREDKQPDKEAPGEHGA